MESHSAAVQACSRNTRYTAQGGEGGCHAQSLAATIFVTEQLSWLSVESFYLSCSISWIIDNLYLLDY